MLSLVYDKQIEQMLKRIAFLVLVATVCSHASAEPPSPKFKLNERPVIADLDIQPSFTNLFKSLNPANSQVISSNLSFTGISSSNNVAAAYYLLNDTHLHAKLGQMLPDGSKLVSIDFARGHITTNKDDTFTTYTLSKDD